jgi:hypothetical protein
MRQLEGSQKEYTRKKLWRSSQATWPSNSKSPSPYSYCSLEVDRANQTIQSSHYILRYVNVKAKHFIVVQSALWFSHWNWNNRNYCTACIVLRCVWPVFERFSVYCQYSCCWVRSRAPWGNPGIYLLRTLEEIVRATQVSVFFEFWKLNKGNPGICPLWILETK